MKKMSINKIEKFKNQFRVQKLLKVKKKKNGQKINSFYTTFN